MNSVECQLRKACRQARFQSVRQTQNYMLFWGDLCILFTCNCESGNLLNTLPILFAKAI